MNALISSQMGAPSLSDALPQGELSALVYHAANSLQVAPHLRHLYAHLLENHHFEFIADFNDAYLHIHSPEVLKSIRQRDAILDVRGEEFGAGRRNDVHLEVHA